MPASRFPGASDAVFLPKFSQLGSRSRAGLYGFHINTNRNLLKYKSFMSKGPRDVADHTTASEVEVVKSSAAGGSRFRFLAALKRAEWLREAGPLIGCHQTLPVSAGLHQSWRWQAKVWVALKATSLFKMERTWNGQLGSSAWSKLTWDHTLTQTKLATFFALMYCTLLETRQYSQA